MSAKTLLTINIDGAARGNPGPAACAYVIVREGHTDIEHAERLPPTTNNVAEYTALVQALERVAELGCDHILILSDSELLVKQMNGEYRVKNEQLRKLYLQAKRACEPFAEVTIRHVRREENSRADRLCNEVLDGTWNGTNHLQPGKSRKLKGAPPPAPDDVQVEALLCLRGAARQWSEGRLDHPSPEQVFQELWQIFQENGVLKG